MTTLDRFLGHDRWATARFLDISRTLTDEQLDQPFDVGHRTLRETFLHMIFSVEVWVAGMTRRPPSDQSDDVSVAALIDRHERSAAAFSELAGRLQAEQRLDETFIDPWLEETTDRTLGNTIVHVILHNAQHRAEARHILERLGVPQLPEGDPKEWEEAILGKTSSA